MTALGQKIKRLVLPPRPDPAQSRRIAEGRLIVSGAVALLLVGIIGTRIVSLADANASLRVDAHSKTTTVERG
ncbi:MAG: penicillin-binding protein 2, partial [Candidatus Puniceispirillum sp.]